MSKGHAVDVLNPFSRAPKVAAPGRSPEEAALMQEQTELLRQQRTLLDRQLREQDLLSGFAFQEAGYRATRDEQGNITGYEEIPEADLSPEKLEERQIESLFRKRSLAALRGELPVDPALTRSLKEDRQNLEASLRRNLGSGFETSTPGIQALAEQELRGNEMLDRARRGDLTLAEQLGQARTGANLQTAGGNINEILGINQRYAPMIGQGTQLSQAYASPIASYFGDRQLRAQVDVGNADRLFNQRRAVAQTFASIFGTAMKGS